MNSRRIRITSCTEKNKFENNESGQSRPNQYRQDQRPDANEESSLPISIGSSTPIAQIAEQVRKNPSLLNNREFVQNHPELQTYLRDNPGFSEEVMQDGIAFMHQERPIGRRTTMASIEIAMQRNVETEPSLTSSLDVAIARSPNRFARIPRC